MLRLVPVAVALSLLAAACSTEPEVTAPLTSGAPTTPATSTSPPTTAPPTTSTAPPATSATTAAVATTTSSTLPTQLTTTSTPTTTALQSPPVVAMAPIDQFMVAIEAVIAGDMDMTECLAGELGMSNFISIKDRQPTDAELEMVAPCLVGISGTSSPAVGAGLETSTSGPLSWPDDVGVSHFGHISSGVDGGPGGWRRPHPGPFIWGEIEREPGRYSWRQTDRVVSKMQDDRVGIISTIWPFADWDQYSCHANEPKYPAMLGELGDSLYPPCDMDAYGAWVQATVERYDGDGIDDMPGLAYPIRHWEVANEPEMQGPESMSFFQGDPNSYLELLTATSSAIRAADSEASVLLGGQAGMFGFMVDYWIPVLEGASGLFDIGNIHSISSDDSFFSGQYRNFLDAFDYSTTPFWVTEAEIGAMPGSSRSEDELAQLAFTGSVISFLYGAEVVVIAGAAYGRPRVSQAIRDAWEAVVDAVGVFDAVTPLSSTSARFDMPDGSTVYALWNGAVLPSEVTGLVRVVRYDGLEASVDTATIDAASASLPIFVMVSQS